MTYCLYKWCLLIGWCYRCFLGTDLWHGIESLRRATTDCFASYCWNTSKNYQNNDAYRTSTLTQVEIISSSEKTALIFCMAHGSTDSPRFPPCAHNTPDDITVVRPLHSHSNCRNLPTMKQLYWSESLPNTQSFRSAWALNTVCVCAGRSSVCVCECVIVIYAFMMIVCLCVCVFICPHGSSTDNVHQYPQTATH